MSDVIALRKDFQEENLWNLSELSSSSFVPVVQAVTVGLISTSESGSTSAKLPAIMKASSHGLHRNSGSVSQVDSTSFDVWMDLEALSAGLCSVGMYYHCFGFEDRLILCTILWTYTQKRLVSL